MRPAAFLLLASAALLSCDATAPATGELSWRFIDGRRCDDAGVQHVEIHGAGPSPLRVVCDDGLAPGGVYRLEVAEAPARLTLEGLTLSGAPLYRGHGLLPAEGGPLLITLRFVGGE